MIDTISPRTQNASNAVTFIVIVAIVMMITILLQVLCITAASCHVAIINHYQYFALATANYLLAAGSFSSWDAWWQVPSDLQMSARQKDRTQNAGGAIPQHCARRQDRTQNAGRSDIPQRLHERVGLEWKIS